MCIDIHRHLGMADDEFALFRIADDPQAAVPALFGALAASQNKIVLLPPLYYAMPEGAADIMRLNRIMASALRAGSGSVIGAFGVVEPKHGVAAFAELERIAEYGLAGVVWSPRAQGLFVDDRLMVDLCRQARKLGLLSMVHATPQSLNEALHRIWHLAEQCPDAKFIVLGALASWEHIGMIMAAAHAPENICYDTSGLADVSHLTHLAQKLGEDRLLFGSGAHENFRHADLCRLQTDIESSALSASLKNAILCKNASNLLKLNETSR